MKTLEALLVDPSLISGAGHHYAYLNQHRAEFAKLQISTTALASRYVDAEFCQQVGVIPSFERSLHYRSTFTRAEFEELAVFFERDLTSAVRLHRLQPDIILLPTADQSMTLGMARYLKQCRRRNKPEVLIWLLTSPHLRKPADDPSVGPLLAEYEKAFAVLREAMSDDARVHIFTETDAMAAVYQPYCGLNIQAVTVRKRLQRPRAPRQRQPGDPLNIVCAGSAARAKGYALLPETISRLNLKRNDLRFFVHGTVEHTGYPEAKCILEALPSLGTNVTVRTDILSGEQYISWLSQADVIILPYDTYVYRTHGSAIFDEAVALGIPIVAPELCDFPRSAISEGRAVGIGEVTSEGLADAINFAANHIEQLSDRAARYAMTRAIDSGLRDTLATIALAAKRRLPTLDLLRKRWRNSFARRLHL